jgi:di/tricarboxylate transporter
MPEPPSVYAVTAIALTFVAILLFTRDKLPLESSSFVILILILVWFEFFPIELAGARLRADDVVAGFGNEALITIAALMILARGLERTGALQPLSHVLARLWSVRPNAALLATILTAAIVSMFLNNTPVVALILPLLIAVSMRSGLVPSRILMPVGFATIIGGSATTIGTSTNLLITSIAADLGMREMQMFDFALPVFIVGGFALLYLWLVAPKLVPDRRPPMTDVEPRIFESRLRINEGSFADGTMLSEVLAQTNGQMKVSKLLRGDLTLMKLPSALIRAGDLLHVSDSPESLKEYERLLGATLLPNAPGQEDVAGRSLQSSDNLAEIVVTRGSELDNNTLDATRQLSIYDLIPLALHRPGRPSHQSTEDLGSVRLGAGDVILVQGSTKALDRLHRSGKLLVLDGRLHLPRAGKAAVATAIMAGVVTLAAFELLPISLAALSGLLLMIVTRCMTWRDALDALDRRIIMVIVASLALGLALMATGAAAWIASLYVALTEGLPVAVVLSGFILIMALMTEVVTNNAVGVVGTPIAIGIAGQLGAPVEPFVLGLLFAANMSYLMPIGYQTNLLVMSAGGYRFSDFLRVGLPLQLIMWLGLSLVLPTLYGL